MIITGTEGQHFCVGDHKEHTTVAHPTRVPMLLFKVAYQELIQGRWIGWLATPVCSVHNYTNSLSTLDLIYLNKPFL